MGDNSVASDCAGEARDMTISVGVLNQAEAIEAIAELDRILDKLRGEGEWSDSLCRIRNELTSELGKSYQR